MVEKIEKMIELVNATLTSKAAQIINKENVYGCNDAITLDAFEKAQSEYHKIAFDHAKQIKAIFGEGTEQAECNTAVMAQFEKLLNGHTNKTIDPKTFNFDIKDEIYESFMALQENKDCLNGVQMRVANDLRGEHGLPAIKKLAEDLCKKCPSEVGKLEKILNHLASASVAEKLVAHWDIPEPAEANDKNMTMGQVAQDSIGNRLACFPNNQLLHAQYRLKAFCAEHTITCNDLEQAGFEERIGLVKGSFTRAFQKVNKPIMKYLNAEDANEKGQICRDKEAEKLKADVEKIENMEPEEAEKYKTGLSDFGKHEVRIIRENKEREEQNKKHTEKEVVAEPDDLAAEGKKPKPDRLPKAKYRILHRAFYRLWKSCEKLVKMMLGSRQMAGYFYKYCAVMDSINVSRDCGISYKEYLANVKRGNTVGIAVDSGILPVIRVDGENVQIANLNPAEITGDKIYLSHDEITSYNERLKEIEEKEQGNTQQPAQQEPQEQEQQQAQAQPAQGQQPQPAKPSPKKQISKAEFQDLWKYYLPMQGRKWKESDASFASDRKGKNVVNERYYVPQEMYNEMLNAKALKKQAPKFPPEPEYSI